MKSSIQVVRVMPDIEAKRRIETRTVIKVKRVIDVEVIILLRHREQLKSR